MGSAERNHSGIPSAASNLQQRKNVSKQDLTLVADGCDDHSRPANAGLSEVEDTDGDGDGTAPEWTAGARATACLGPAGSANGRGEPVTRWHQQIQHISVGLRDARQSKPKTMHKRGVEW